MNNYDDIINISYPFKLKHTRINIESRAAIFAPFSALSGYAESINEAGRETKEKIYLDEDKKEIINNKFNELKNNNFKVNVEIEYFVKDKYKEGGKYLKIRSKIKKLDIYNNLVVLIDKTKIRIDAIIDINYIN